MSHWISTRCILSPDSEAPDHKYWRPVTEQTGLLCPGRFVFQRDILKNKSAFSYFLLVAVLMWPLGFSVSNFFMNICPVPSLCWTPLFSLTLRLGWVDLYLNLFLGLIQDVSRPVLSKWKGCSSTEIWISSDINKCRSVELKGIMPSSRDS